MSIIIDPPVTPFSPLERIHGWIDHLLALRLRRGLSRDDADRVSAAIDDALRMLSTRAPEAAAARREEIFAPSEAVAHRA